MAGSSVSLFMQNRINHKFEISIKVTILHMYIKQNHTFHKYIVHDTMTSSILTNPANVDSRCVWGRGSRL